MKNIIVWTIVIWIFVSLTYGTPADPEHSHQEEWHIEYPLCKLSKQSPINLSSKKAKITDIPLIKFHNYNLTFKKPATVYNNGHTLKILLANDINEPLPYIDGGILSNSFNVESVHFHWGSNDTHGSEHVIDGNRYSMEMHIVHVRGDDQRVVIGVMFQAKASSQNNKGFNYIDDVINKVENFDSKANLSPNFSVGSLIENLNDTSFYTYEGSFTTPPCTETVTWIVYKNTIPISKDLMYKFRHIHDATGRKIQDNFRYLQRKSSRVVLLRKGH